MKNQTDGNLSFVNIDTIILKNPLLPYSKPRIPNELKCWLSLHFWHACQYFFDNIIKHDLPGINFRQLWRGLTNMIYPIANIANHGLYFVA